MTDIASTITDEILDKDESLEKIRGEDAAKRRKIKLDVSAAKIASLIPFTLLPDGLTPYALNAICFEPAPEGGVLIIATNRHSIAIRHDPDGLLTTHDEKPLLINPRAGQTKTLHPVFAGLQNSKPYSSVRLIIKDDSITQHDGRPGTYALEPLLHTEGGTFPNWRGIIKPFLKAKPYHATAAFAANILARFDFQPKQKAEETHAVLLWQEPQADPIEPNLSPIFVTSSYPASADMIGAFMPINANHQKDASNLITPPRNWVATLQDADPAKPSTAHSNGKIAA